MLQRFQLQAAKPPDPRGPGPLKAPPQTLVTSVRQLVMVASVCYLPVHPDHVNDVCALYWPCPLAHRTPIGIFAGRASPPCKNYYGCPWLWMCRCAWVYSCACVILWLEYHYISSVIMYCLIVNQSFVKVPANLLWPYARPGMGDRLCAGKPPRFVTSRLGQLSLLPSAGWKMSIGQSAMTLCSWE